MHLDFSICKIYKYIYMIYYRSIYIYLCIYMILAFVYIYKVVR